MTNSPLHAPIDEFLRVLDVEQARSLNTIAAYRNDLVQFTRYVEESFLQDGASAGRDGDFVAGQIAPDWTAIDAARLAAYVNALTERGYAAATITRKVAAIRSFYQWLEGEGALAQNPTLGIDGPKPQPATLTPLHADEIHRLLAEASREQTPYALRDGALMQLLCTLGLRVNEVVSLDDSHIDLPRAVLTSAGSARKRLVALPEDVLRALMQYLEEGRLHLQVDPSERALFLNHRGKRLTRQGLWLIVKRYAALVGIAPNVTPHMLRQSFALHQIDRGVDPKGYAHAMGSSSRRSAQDYRRMAKRIDGAAGSDGLDGTIPSAGLDGSDPGARRGTITIDGKLYRAKDRKP